MVVQVAALGHAGEKCAQSERAGRAGLLHAGCGLLFRRAELRMRGKKLKQKKKQQSKLRETGSRTESNFLLELKSRAVRGVTFS
jgi:hypothetical protein